MPVKVNTFFLLQFHLDAKNYKQQLVTEIVCVLFIINIYLKKWWLLIDNPLSLFLPEKLLHQCLSDLFFFNPTSLFSIVTPYF